MRRIPIFTFVNKMDRLGRDPFELMSEIEEVLGIDAVPVNWPVGQGSEFLGVYDRIRERLLTFSGGKHGTARVEEVEVKGAVDSPDVQEALGIRADEIAEALELLDGAGAAFDLETTLAGEQTPMFFGSALTNFGVSPFLDRFLELAPCPGARESDEGPIDPVEHGFSGFVFKIQANMDPDHRDRVAFLRVCSGRFVKDASAVHVRTGKKLRLSKSTLVQARGRESVDEAFPGDVVGLFDPGIFRIGDTVSDGGSYSFAGIPTFAPEMFGRVEVAEVLKRKSLEKGLDQLAQEGAVQLFFDEGAGSAAPIIGAMGQLQFDVLTHRMESEYKVKLRITPLPHQVARWPVSGFDADDFRFSEAVKVVADREGRPVLLLKSPWYLERIAEKHPDLVLSDAPDRVAASD
jgi:peptide chain release factor 3